MGKIVDLVGKRFGRLSVHSLDRNQNGVLYWNCTCDCGEERSVFGGDLKRGTTLSCGCLMKERAADRKRSHGKSFHPAYRSWIELKSRCENPENDGYHLYGGRGILVDPRWSGSFEAFWADMGPTWGQGLTIDRINVNGNYEAANCRWATRKEQAQNRRTNHLIETPDGTMTIADAARKYGVSEVTISSRLRYGWTDPRKLVSPRYSERNTNNDRSRNEPPGPLGPP